MKKKIAGVFCAGLCSLGLASLADGAVIFSHYDSNDPTTEGWNYNNSPDNLVGPVFNDLGLGIDAWNVTDTSMSGGGPYTQILSASDQAILNNGGSWTMRLNARVVDGIENIFGNNHNSNGFGFSPPTSFAVNLELGMQPDGDPIAFLLFGESVQDSHKIVVEGGASQYHLYEMRYDPLSDTASLFIDSVLKFSGYTGSGTGSLDGIVRFGGGSTQGLGSANYNLFEIGVTAVPIPSAVWLFSGGLLGLMGVAKRTH